MLEPNAILQGRYLILRPIGQGGMGAVYLAKDERLGNLVALKETFFSDVRMLKAFEREARLLASLRHLALPRVSDHFAEGTGQFLVMEYIAGDDLEKMLTARGHAFAPADVLTWADQLLDALDYLHTQSPPIIHRDIKPQNLKLTERGQIILLDFGLAKGAINSTGQATAQSSILGYTPGYAPLEQIQAAGTDERSDLFSLAATLYRLMTYTPPPDALRRAMAVLNGESDPLELANEINPDVSAAVAGVLNRAMALKRDARPATASAMRQALLEAGRASAEPVGLPQSQMSAGGTATHITPPDASTVAAQAAAPSSPAARPTPAASAASSTIVSPSATAAPVRRRRLWAIVVLVALLVTGAVSWLMLSRRAEPSAANVNSNATADGTNANANQPLINANRETANLNRATGNANVLANDESSLTDESRPRTIGKKKKGRVVSGTEVRGLHNMFDLPKKKKGLVVSGAKK